MERPEVLVVPDSDRVLDDACDILEDERPRLLKELVRQHRALKDKDTARTRDAHRAVTLVNAHFAEMARG